MEVDQAFLDKIKKHIRRTHSELDDDLCDTIKICLADLKACGVHEPEQAEQCIIDPLILRAVRLFCKATEEDDPAKSKQFQQCYEHTKSFLMMAGEYKGEAANE